MARKPSAKPRTQSDPETKLMAATWRKLGALEQPAAIRVARYLLARAEEPRPVQATLDLEEVAVK